jgi:nucleotide-binding universal stress UspA family protein
MAMAASARTRHLLVALPRDAAEALATLNYTRDYLRKSGDAITLVHVRLADITAAHLDAPFSAVEEPLSALADDVLLGDAASVIAAASEAGAKTLVKLRTPLPIFYALMSYTTCLSDDDPRGVPSLLVMGSHTAATNPQAWTFCSRTTHDAAALSPLPVVIVRDAPSTAGGRFMVVAVDGRAPSSSLLVKWACANVLRPKDTILLCHKPDAAGILALKDEVQRCGQMLEAFVGTEGKAITNHQLSSEYAVQDALVDLAQSGAPGVWDGPPHMLILSSRGPGALKRATPLGSVCAYVVRHAQCSLAVVPPPALAQ